AHASDPRGISLSGDGTLVATSSSGGTIEVWRADDGAAVWRSDPGFGGARFVGDELVLAHGDREAFGFSSVARIDPRTGARTSLIDDAGACTAFAIDDDVSRVFAACAGAFRSAPLQRWDLATGRHTALDVTTDAWTLD